MFFIPFSVPALYENTGVRIQNTEEKQYHGYSGSWLLYSCFVVPAPGMAVGNNFSEIIDIRYFGYGIIYLTDFLSIFFFSVFL